MPWQRPESVPLGQVWSRFKGREREGKPTHMYQIRDMDSSIRKKCLDFMQEVFIRDEPLCKILDIKSDPESISTIRSNWESYVSQNVSLACFTEVNGEPDELVGFNIIVVKSKDDEEEDIDQVKGESWKKLLRTLIEAENLVDIFKHYGVDKFLTSSGLTVLPEHRGQNIGARLFAAREPLCKALGVEATATVFTAYESQVLAAKCGYEVLAELQYKDMIKYNIDLTGCETPHAKLMGIKFKKSQKENDLKSDPESISTIRSNWDSYVAQNVSLACFTEVNGKPDELVGFNVVYVKSKDDEEEEDIDQVKGETWKKILRTLNETENQVDIFKYYGVDKFLTSCGLTVLPEHRGQNIGARLFAAREPLCKALGLDATATVFTAYESQVLAAKCGYEVLAELQYKDMIKYNIELTGCETPHAKLMGTKFKK